MNKIEQFSWQEIKQLIKPVNSSFFEVVEQISPDDSIPFFISHYDFGEHFGVNHHAYLPSKSGELVKLNSKNTENHLYRHLGYGENSLPLGIILDKYCEWHYFGDNNRIYPDCIQGPGAIFNIQVVFDETKTVANNVLSASSGALSSFLLPNIGCKRKHARIQRHFNVTSPAPKSPYEHYLVFKEILQSRNSQCNWQSKILYFSEEFVNQVKHNDEWLKLKLYFSEELRKKLTKNTYDASCNDLFLSAKRVNRFRPTPFLIDTAKYIFNICMGSGIGVKPTIDEQYIPLRDIQTAYTHCYGLEYIPTVMVPSSLSDHSDSVYYPLQCPTAKINTFKTNQSSSTFSELETLRNILIAYQDEFTDEQGAAFGSPLYHFSKDTEFTFYHYQANNNDLIQNSIEVKDSDPRFLSTHTADATTFASDAKLFRGCVKLSRHT